MISIDLADSASLGENGSKALLCSGDFCVCVQSSELELVALSIVTLIPPYSHCASSTGLIGVASGVARFCITLHGVSSVASPACTWFT